MTVTDVNRIVKAYFVTPMSKIYFFMYVSSYIDNFEGKKLL